MTTTLRGADIVMRALAEAGRRTVFTLSGNHVMSLFDAALDAEVDLLHVRHEAAAVHMADAWGRLTGEPGIALVTGGPGHANTPGALFTALGQESPLVLLSGHTPQNELGRGGFQELRQAEMAATVTKVAWMATSAAGLADDVARAIRIAKSGRPGPVQVSLPGDVLEARLSANEIARPAAGAHLAPVVTLAPAVAEAAVRLLATAKRPLILAGPRLASRSGRDLLARLEEATGAAAVVMDSTRGLNDAALGDFNAIARRADLVLLLGKAFDYTLRFGDAFEPDCRWLSIDPEAALVERLVQARAARVELGAVADSKPAAEALLRASNGAAPDTGWRDEVRAALAGRPDWSGLSSSTPGKLHPVEVFRALAPHLDADPDAVLICDGGDYSQWGQSFLGHRRRMLNGISGEIGVSLPFALAARLAEPRAPVFAVLGDGSFGYHMAEFETAVRRDLPFVAIVGNDAHWNAEYQIQLRTYGAARAHGCELTPARYDLVATALGGHGELVTEAAAMPGAIARALASGKPACINVMCESIPTPVVRRAVGPA